MHNVIIPADKEEKNLQNQKRKSGFFKNPFICWACIQ